MGAVIKTKAVNFIIPCNYFLISRSRYIVLLLFLFLCPLNRSLLCISGLHLFHIRFGNELEPWNFKAQIKANLSMALLFFQERLESVQYQKKTHTNSNTAITFFITSHTYHMPWLSANNSIPHSIALLFFQERLESVQYHVNKVTISQSQTYNTNLYIRTYLHKQRILEYTVQTRTKILNTNLTLTYSLQFKRTESSQKKK